LNFNQQTISDSISISGNGLHTGKECRLTLNPADIDTGIIFFISNKYIKANVNNVSDTLRGTSLSCGNVEIHTVEHILSALAGMNIDNALIEFTASEIPILDGSALPFVQMIDAAGIESQDAPARICKASSMIWKIKGDKCLSASPSNCYNINVLMSYNHPLLGDQGVNFCIDPNTYRKEIAPARTFCTSQEIDYILSQGLGKGGNKSNVVVAYEDRYSTELRFRDEPVRHKLLDIIGDMSLSGGRIQANIFGLRTGHSINIKLAAEISANWM
jgi:UDP-3-O-[3-hydroxymyristoyl] N-acetylglucosamine deacetylase